jgi:serine/threonine protein kinase
VTSSISIPEKPLSSIQALYNVRRHDMTRMQLIQAVYASVSDQEPAKRNEFLNQACRGDEELRREVEALLSKNESECPTRSIVTPGTMIGPYRIEAPIGAGGMGEVFRAIDTRLGRTVAIKFTTERFQERFEREGRAISALNHPYICTLYDVGQNYLVMEFIDGQTIAARIRRQPLLVDEARLYATQIAGALAEAHARGIVHRDLKPGNIMIGPRGVKVLDFGLAKSVTDEPLTVSGIVVGTPGYMAPEQREGHVGDERSDIYSFGCVLYEMLTGKRVSSDRQPVSSRALERIIGRCLEIKPENRWASAAHLVRELEKTAAIGHRWRIWAPALAALVAGLVVVYWFSSRQPKLTDKDSIVLADFQNKTADPAFDDVLKPVLTISLKQSPFLNVVSDARVAATLKFMTKPVSTPLTPEVARDVCARTGSQAYITGALTSVGSNYAIHLKAVNCESGDQLAAEIAQAPKKEKVIDAVGQAASRLRGALGESLSSVQKFDSRLSSATTSSLEALKEYTLGTRIQSSKGDVEAIPYFQRAIEILPGYEQFLGELKQTSWA